MIEQKIGISLKESIENSLGSLLGMYELPSGQIIKAIAINPSPGHLIFPPQGTKTKGLECHIYYPEIKAKSIISGANWDSTWLIILKQWDCSKTTILATRKIVSKCSYPIISVFRNPPNININQPEISQIKIIYHELI